MTEQWQAELDDRQKQRDFERYKFDREVEARETEASAASGRGLRMTPAQATVAAAILGLLGGTIGGVIQWKSTSGTEQIRGDATGKAELIKAQGQLDIEKEKSRATIELERKKFETTLILKAVESDDEGERIRNLKFYLTAGFITDPDGKLAAIKPGDYPSNQTRTSTPFLESDVSDPAFSAFPKPLLDMLRTTNGGVANITMLQSATATVERLVKAKLNDNQKSALVSLIYNTGPGRFSKSTLLADVNSNRSDRIFQDFLELMPHAGTLNKVLEARLEARRRAEAELFLAPAN